MGELDDHNLANLNGSNVQLGFGYGFKIDIKTPWGQLTLNIQVKSVLQHTYKNGKMMPSIEEKAQISLTASIMSAGVKTEATYDKNGFNGDFNMGIDAISLDINSIEAELSIGIGVYGSVKGKYSFD